MTLFTLDLLGNGKAIMNALTTESMNELNHWLGHYVSEGYIPQIRVVDHAEPYTEVELG